MNNRNTLLDGLRGLLSLVVVLNHSFLVIAIPEFANVWGQNYLKLVDWPSKIQQIMMILGNGGTAVSMFFVLSGFVLNYSLNKFEWKGKYYLWFLFKRLLRLYPAFFFTILLISIFRWLGFDYRTFPHASSWYHWWMNFNLDTWEFFMNAIFVRINLGGVTWTLRVIALFSIVAPLAYYVSRSLSPIKNALVAIFLTYISFNLLNIEGFRDLRYFYMFYLGLIIPQFEGFFTKFPKKLLYVLLPFLVYIMLAIRYQTGEYFGGLVESYISFFILGLIIFQPSNNLFKFLNNKFLLYIGRISYAVYLVHFSVLYTVARVMFQFLPGINYTEHYLLTHFVLLITSFIITIPVSTFVYRFVEQPPLKLLKNK